MVAEGFREAFEKGEAFAIQGQHVQAVDAFSQALNHVVAQESPKAFAVAALKAGEQAHRAGWYEEALGFFQKVAVCDVVPIELRLRASTHQSVLAMGVSDIKDAYGALTQSLKLAQDAGDVAAEAQHQGNLGLVLLRMGEVQAARASLYEAAKLYGEAGDARNQAQSWNALGNVLLRLGDADAAEAHFQDAYRALQEQGAEQQASIPLANIAHLMRRRGETNEALDLYRKVHAAMVGQGDLGAGSLLDVAMAELDRGHWQAADNHLNEAGNLSKSDAMNARIGFVRIDWLSENGRYEEALNRGNTIQSVFEERGDIQGIVGVHLSRARINWMLGEEQDAFPDEVYRVDLPELRIAVQSLNAERAYANADWSTAREILSSFQEPLENLKHLNRVRRIRNLMLALDLHEGLGTVEDICDEFMKNTAEIRAGGNIRDFMAATFQMVLPLTLLGHTKQAGRLLEEAESLRKDEWPLLWHHQLDRMSHLIRCVEGSAENSYNPPNPSQVVQTQAVDRFLRAVEQRDSEEITKIAQGLEENGRMQLANLIRGCAERLNIF